MTEKKRKTDRKFLTSNDVARKAGVSRTAVSYALNGQPNAHVSEETRAKILQAAQELGYTTHSLARALRKGQSEEICFIVDLPFSIHRTELFVSLHQHALLNGCTLVVYYSHSLSAEQLQELLLKIFARRPMGLIATARSMSPENVILAQRMGVENVVLYSVKPLEYAPTILLPTELSGRLAAQHLLDRGHRRIGLVQPTDPLEEYGFLQRLQGMRSVIGETPGASLEILPLQYSLPAAYTFVDTYLTTTNHPTGLYGYNDEYSLLLLGALIDRGVQIPEEVAVIGTDDILFSEMIRPTLTTIRLDNTSFGQRAVDIILDLHIEEQLADKLTFSLVPQLVQRQST
jgi:LacI family transcriptional regulator